MKRFTGTVKPFFNLDGLGLTIRYGEMVSLATWQVEHPSFQFALENGWVLAADQRSIVFNPIHSQKPKGQRAARSKPAELAQELPEQGLDPAVIQSILAKQEGFVRQAQKTFERLTQQKKEPDPLVSPEVLTALLENQKRMMEMLSERSSVKVDTPPTTDPLVLNALRLLTSEVKRLQESKPEGQTLNTDQLLEGVKQVISQYAPTSSYNGPKRDTGGFQVRDDFEEKFVPKVEDFDVKNSKIVAQEKDSGSVEDVLAALRKLKENK